MKTIIYTTISIILLSIFANAQKTTIWLNGNKTDPAIVKKKADLEAQGLKVFVNDIAEREKRHLNKIVATGDEKFDRLFREAREAMDKEEWKQAVEKFNQIICDCPENKQVDAAFYWLAYSYNKQKMYKEASATIERLLKNFPNSSWADDARVMKYQIGSRSWSTAGTVSTGGVYFPGQNNLTTTPVYSVGQGISVLGDVSIAGGVSGQQNQIDREDEIKLAAFQSLWAADPKKAIDALGNLLGANSKASEVLKIQILRSLRGNRWAYRTVNDELFTTTEPSPTTVVNEINPLLRDALMKAYKSETSPKVRPEILYSIAHINDEASVNYLAQLYSNESSKEMKKFIINSFAVVPYFYGFTTFDTPIATAVRSVATTEQKAKIEAETAATAPRPSQNTTKKTPDTNPVRELRFAKLMEIFRNEKDLELKRTAFSAIQRFGGWSNRDGMVGMLAQLYDAETDNSFKMSIINSFSSLTKNAQATNKLLDIAKNEKSDELRLQAIRALRNNPSPEVIKFLEDLLR